jgi:hypothetical protein
MDTPINHHSVEERRTKDKEVFLSHLRKMPIVHIACERTGIGRTTYYRWRKEDAEFSKKADEAMADSEAMITDLSESQLITLIKEKNWAAINLWLRTHHPKYGNKLELSGTVNARMVKDFSEEEKKELQQEFLKLFNQVVDTGYKPTIPNEDPTKHPDA